MSLTVDPLSSLDRSTLRERALEALRAAITSGQYRPGDRLGEVELAKHLGVSRGTVREALRHLQQEGLVTAGNRGMLRVNAISPKEVRELFRVRAALEGIRLNAAVGFALFLAFAIHIANFVGVYFLARSLRVDITCFQVLVMMPLVFLFVMLPITINGHGLRELLLIGYFTHLGVHISGQTDIGYRESAVALSLLLVANDLLWSLAGGLQYFARTRPGAEPKLIVSPTC
jgi:biotin operon repressor